MRGRTSLLLGLLVGLTSTAAAQITIVRPAASTSVTDTVAAETSLPSAGSTTVDPVRVQQLRQSLALTDLVPGVSRGWEGDPRTETWVSRCDDHGDRNACWLVGVQLAPAIESAANTSLGANRYYAGGRNPSGRAVAVQYLKRGCEL